MTSVLEKAKKTRCRVFLEAVTTSTDSNMKPNLSNVVVFVFYRLLAVVGHVPFALKQQTFRVYYFLPKRKKLLGRADIQQNVYNAPVKYSRTTTCRKISLLFFADNSSTDEFTKASNKTDKQRNNMTSEYEILMIYVNESIIYYLFA